MNHTIMVLGFIAIIFASTSYGASLGIPVAIIVVLVLLVANIVSAYNRMKAEKIKISEARSNMGVYLQQRFEEISTMYKIVQEFKNYEVDTLKQIIKLRQLVAQENMSFKDKTKIHNEIERQIPGVLATFENYPELQSNENFLRLQDSIENNEANIASSRKGYNDYVNRYNTSIAMFPSNLLAKLFNFEKEDLYETPASRKENPLL
ncbi:LemA family protein [Bacillus megaterium]|nr:LemA family protein [Priestia megaterium]